MPKVKNKGFIIIDPFEDKTIFHIFNDLIEKHVVAFPYEDKPDIWIKASSKIGRRCKALINISPPLMHPPSTSRGHKLGFITLPEDVEINMIPYGKDKKKILFNRKIF